MIRAVRQRPEAGSVSILAAVAAIALIGVTALGIDLGYGLLTKAQLQNVADAAALAGNHQLARLYDALGNTDTSGYTLTASDKASIIQAAQSHADRNATGGESVRVLPEDVLFGRWDRKAGQVVETSTGVNVVRVLARREGSSNGVLSTLLSSTIGVDSFDVQADAAAALSPVHTVPAGALGLPVGISKAWFEHPGSPCSGNSAIRLFPTGSFMGCANWHTYQDEDGTSLKLQEIMDRMRAGTFKAPPATAGVTQFHFQGAVETVEFPDVRELWRQNRDGNNEWKVLLPVYDSPSCENVSGSARIVGFATTTITNVVSAPAKQIDARVDCDVIHYGQSGGNDFGTHVAGGRLIE